MEDRLIAVDVSPPRSQSQAGIYRSESQLSQRDSSSCLISIRNINPPRKGSLSSLAELKGSINAIDEKSKSNSALLSRGGLKRSIDASSMNSLLKSDFKLASPYAIVKEHKEKLKKLQLLNNEDTPKTVKVVNSQRGYSPKSQTNRNIHRSQSQDLSPQTVLIDSLPQISLAFDDHIQLPAEKKKRKVFRINQLVDEVAKPHDFSRLLQANSQPQSPIKMTGARTSRVSFTPEPSISLSPRKFVQTPVGNFEIPVDKEKETNPRHKPQHGPARHIRSEKPLLSQYFSSEKINHADLGKFSSLQLQNVKKTIKPINAKKLPFYYEISEDPTISLQVKRDKRLSVFNENLIKSFYGNAKKKPENKQQLMEKILQQRLPEDYTKPAIFRAGNRRRRNGGILGEIDFSEKKVDLEEKVVDPVDEMKDREHNDMLKISVLQIVAPTNPLGKRGVKPADEKLLSVLKQGTRKIRPETQKNFKRIRQHLLEALQNLARLGLTSEDVTLFSLLGISYFFIHR